MKKIIVWLVTAALAAAALTGCKEKKADGAGTSKTMEEARAKPSESDAGEGKAVARGRYVESFLSLPAEGEDAVVRELIERPDGKLEMYIESGDGEVRVYAYDGNEWQETTSALAAAVNGGEHELISRVSYVREGELYAVLLDQSYKPHLYHSSSDQPLFKVPVKEVEEWEYGIIESLHAGSDGTAFLPLWKGMTMRVNQDGGLVAEYPQTTYPIDFCDAQALTENSYVTGGERGFLRYDLQTNEEVEEIPFQSGEADAYAALAAGNGEDIYLCNSQGIHHMVENGTVWEMLVDGSLTSLSLPSAEICRLFVGDKGDFYVWLKERETSRIAHYTFDAEMPSVPADTLTVYGLDLDGNKTIRQAAVLYQSSHPNVRVEVLDGQSGAGGASVSDTIRALHTELLNGQGADILILDGLPVDAYIEKGVLEDLRDVIGPLAESGELYPNIVKNFTGQDGVIWQFPSRLVFPITYGEQDTIRAYDSLGAYEAFQAAHPEEALLGKTTYQNILRQLITMYAPELMDGDGMLSEEKVTRLLNLAKTAGDAGHCAVRFDASEDGGRGDSYNKDLEIGELIPGYAGVWRKEAVAVAAVDLPKGMMDLAYPYALIEEKNWTMSQPGGIYYPVGCLGVTSFSRKKEIAKDFVQFVLSEEVQKNDLWDGITINEKAADAWIARDLNYSMQVGFSDSKEVLRARYPDQEKRRRFFSMMDGLKTPIVLDRVLADMIVEESTGYFDGIKSAEETAAFVVNKARLYETE